MIYYLCSRCTRNVECESRPSSVIIWLRHHQRWRDVTACADRYNTHTPCAHNFDNSEDSICLLVRFSVNFHISGVNVYQEGKSSDSLKTGVKRGYWRAEGKRDGKREREMMGNTTYVKNQGTFSNKIMKCFLFFSFYFLQQMKQIRAKHNDSRPKQVLNLCKEQKKTPSKINFETEAQLSSPE